MEIYRLYKIFIVCCVWIVVYVVVYFAYVIEDGEKRGEYHVIDEIAASRDHGSWCLKYVERASSFKMFFKLMSFQCEFICRITFSNTMSELFN